MNTSNLKTGQIYVVTRDEKSLELSDRLMKFVGNKDGQLYFTDVNAEAESHSQSHKNLATAGTALATKIVYTTEEIEARFTHISKVNVNDIVADPVIVEKAAFEQKRINAEAIVANFRKTQTQTKNGVAR
jgi:hypothetical protein